MALQFWLFQSPWGKGYQKGDRRLREASYYPKVRVEKKMKYRCQHDGCDATKIGWKKVGTVKREELDELAEETTI